jgi:hypothetical protein
MPDSASVSIRFSGGALTADSLEAEIASFMQELADPRSDVAQLAEAAGLQPERLSQATVKVTQTTKGFGPVAIVVMIVAPVASHLIDKFWDDVIWPTLKKRSGADALGKREEVGDSAHASRKVG